MAADASNWWDARAQRGKTIHTVADQLVPPMMSERIAEVEVLKNAWGVDLNMFRSYALTYDMWYSDICDTDPTPETLLGRALYLVYTEALRNLIVWTDTAEGIAQ